MQELPIKTIYQFPFTVRVDFSKRIRAGIAQSKETTEVTKEENPSNQKNKTMQKTKLNLSFLRAMTNPTRKSIHKNAIERGANLASKIQGSVVESKNNENATHPMVDWKEHASKIKNSLKSQNLLQAKQEIQYALEIYSNHLNLLTIASDVYRALGDREKSLEYAELLITHHPDQWQGYGRAAKDLVELTKVNSSRFYSISESQDRIRLGLEKFPHQLNLLIIASDVYRASGDLEKSLDYAELLITHHPDQRFGYILSAQNLVALKRLEEAHAKVQAGLEKFPHQLNLLIIASNAHHASGNHEESLKYAELLIAHHPDQQFGYIRSAQNLVALKQFEEARAKVQTGLEKFPNQINLLKMSEKISS